MSSLSSPAHAIQRPIWQGEQQVSALWFAHELYSEAQRQVLILAQWQSGAHAYGFATGDLLCWRTPHARRCQQTHGLPLCKIGPILTSAPFTPAEIKRLGIADAYIVQGAQAELLRFAEATPLQPAAWLDLDAYPLQVILPIRQPAAIHALVTPDQLPSVHEVFAGKVPEPAPERNQILQSLMQRRSPQGTGDTAYHQPASLGQSTLLGLTALVAMVVWVMQQLRSVLSFKKRRAPAATKVAPSSWRQLRDRLLHASKLAHLFDRQHAAYLKKMLAMFEQDNLDEALRHALPLSSAQDISLGQQLGMLRPRNLLDYGQAHSNAQSIGIDPNLSLHLQQLYQRAFERFDAAGEVDRAVYVLAELLNKKQIALEYLEKHGRYRQAAELCQTWQMPASFAIRMYLLIGDIEKARWLAVQSQEFAVTVHHLETSHPEHALTLRKIWAHALIQQGRWLEAVEVIWHIESERDKAVAWLRLAEQSHGELGLRAWLQRLILQPEQLVLEMDRARQLCTAAHRAELRLAIQIIMALYRKSSQIAPIPLLNLWAPMMLADWQHGLNDLTAKEVRRWIEWCKNPLLRADLPKLDPKTIIKPQIGLIHSALHLAAPAVGIWEIYDAFPLSNGCTLIALGDAGIVVINADQVEVYRVNVPAHQLTLSDSQEIALLLAKREEGWWVTRLDLVTRQTTILGLTDLTHVAPTFDGIAWTAVGDNNIQVIDTRYSARQLLFTPTPLSAPVIGMTRSCSAEYVLLAGHGGVTLNQYQMPMRRLAASNSVPHAQPPADQVTIGSDGAVISFWYAQEANAADLFKMATWFADPVSIPRPAEFEHYTEAEAQVIGPWTLILFNCAGRIIWMFYHSSTRTCHARIDWDEADHPNFRYFNGEWLLFDRRGRLLKINDQTGSYTPMTLS